MGLHLLLALPAPLRQVTGQHARKRFDQFGRRQPFYDPSDFTQGASGCTFVGQQRVGPLPDNGDHRAPGCFAKA